MSKTICARVNAELLSTTAIEAIYPSDLMMSESKLALYDLGSGGSNIVNSPNENINHLMLFEPWQVRVDEKESKIYFTDVSGGFIYVLNLNTRQVLKRILMFECIPSYFDYFDGKFVLCTDSGVVQCMDMYHGGILWQTELSGANGVCVGEEENIYVTCKRTNTIKVLSKESGKIISTIGERGSGIGQLLFPHDLTLDDMGNIIVCDSGNHRIQAFSKDGSFLYAFGKKGRENGCFESPKGVLFHKKSNMIIVSDTMNNRIQIFDKSNLRFINSFKPSNDDLAFMRPVGLAVSSKMELFVSDFGNHMIHVFMGWNKKPFNIEQNLSQNSSFSDVSFRFDDSQ